MNQFEFTSGQKRTFFIMMGIGLLSMLLTYMMDDQYGHLRFWTNYLHNTVFFAGLAFISTFIIAAFVTAWAGWYVLMKRIWEAFSLFLLPAIILFIPLIAGLWLGWHQLYIWNDPDVVAHDEVLQGKVGLLNRNWYTFGTLLIMGVWYLFAKKMRDLSLEEERNGAGPDFAYHRKLRVWAAGFLPLAGFSSVPLITLWDMSLEPHWYSTLYFWYTGASWFVSAMAVTVLLLFYLRSKGYFPHITDEHIHDLGKYVFAFTIFWAYLWFDQFMLIWYGNVGEETAYFKLRRDLYPVLFYGNIFVNFALPFLVLMRNSTKRKVGTMVLVAIVVILGHWVDFFLMIKPGALMEAQHLAGEHATGGFVSGFTIPGLLELGTFVGFLGLFGYFVFKKLTEAPLEPAHDPYLEESLHHHA